MTWNTYLAFIVAATVLIVMPGSTMMTVVSHAMQHGLRRSLFTIAGVSISHSMFFAITSLGVAALLMASAAVFQWIKWIGVLYLLWMGIRQWTSDPSLPEAQVDKPAADRSGWSLALQGFTVNTTNPNALVFYAAFFPPFLNPSVPAVPQLIVMGATFVSILVAVSFLYALIADRSRTLFNTPKQRQARNRISGSLLVGAGLLLATVHTK
jgi:homoserine/homoserine lactone efflux protein